MDAVEGGEEIPLLVFCFLCRVSTTSQGQTEKIVRGEVSLGNGGGGWGRARGRRVRFLRFRDGERWGGSESWK